MTVRNDLDPLYVPPYIPDPEDHNWKAQAACRGYDPDYWHPVRRTEARFGKRICVNCPVRAQCLLQAMRQREPHGTWGGLSEWDRRDILNRSRRP